MTAAGLLSSAVLYDGIVDFGVQTTPAELYGRLVDYYHPPSTPAARSRADTAPRGSGISRRKLVEVTHFHLFSVPLLLLVLGHIFLLCRLSARAKTCWIGASIGAAALHLFAPWGIYLAGGGLAWLYPISGAGLIVTLGVMMLVPVHDMWRGPAQADTRKGYP